MVRHRRALSGMRAVCSLLAAILFALSLTGCVHYIPREEQSEQTTAEETLTDTEREDEEVTTSAVETDFPNETDDGHTKRY